MPQPSLPRGDALGIVVAPSHRSRAQVPFRMRRITPYYEMGYLLLSVSKAPFGILLGLRYRFRKVVA